MLAYGERPSSRSSTRPGRGRPRAASRSSARSRTRSATSRTTALVGVATQGGRFPPAWRELLKDAVSSGLNVENGLHEFLADDEELRELAARHGVELRDLRRPPADLNVPTGANLEQPTKNVLTVGSDCAIGKMTVSLELDRAAAARGLASRFVPTGQTGIAIAGWGIAVDAVVSDFIAGAAERLVVEGHERGGELLFVEGQGAVTHPAYSGVTLGLIHGSAPHAFVLCHHAGATEVEGYPGHPLLPLPELVELHEWISLPARKARVAAIALNTRELSDDDARELPSPAPRPRRDSSPTIRCASAPTGCSTLSSQRSRVGACSQITARLRSSSCRCCSRRGSSPTTASRSPSPSSPLRSRSSLWSRS